MGLLKVEVRTGQLRLGQEFHGSDLLKAVGIQGKGSG